MIEGKSCSAISRNLGVCSSTIQHRKHRLAVKIVEFMGADILVDTRADAIWVMFWVGVAACFFVFWD